MMTVPERAAAVLLAAVSRRTSALPAPEVLEATAIQEVWETAAQLQPAGVETVTLRWTLRAASLRAVGLIAKLPAGVETMVVRVKLPEAVASKAVASMR